MIQKNQRNKIFTAASHVYRAGLKPVVSSRRGWLVLTRYLAASLSSAAVDYAVFLLVYAAMPSVLTAVYAARLVALAFNFRLNQKLVFHSSRSISATLPRYLALVAFSGFMASLLIAIIAPWVGGKVFIAKILAELTLSLFNYFIQKKLIFKGQGMSAG